jgi:hypothetical protein
MPSLEFRQLGIRFIDATTKQLAIDRSTRYSQGIHVLPSHSGRLRDVVQNQEVRLRTRGNRVGATLVIAKLNQERRLVQLFDDRADLPTRKPMRWKVRQQCHRVQKRRPFALCALLCSRHSTQQVTNLGTLSPVRHDPDVLTTALFSCRLMVALKRQ